MASGSSPRGRLGATLLLAAALAAVGPDRLGRGPRLCLISRVIRRPCPACGMTRAAAALLRGNPRRAIRHNPRIVPVALITVAMLFSDTRAIMHRRQRRSLDRTPGAADYVKGVLRDDVSSMQGV